MHCPYTKVFFVRTYVAATHADLTSSAAVKPSPSATLSSTAIPPCKSHSKRFSHALQPIPGYG